MFVDGTDITRLRGAALDEIRRRYGVVFQGGALFDSMSVTDNVAFPLREKTRLSAAEIRSRVEEKLEQVGLAGMGDKNPAEISGGMRKRVAIARALVTEPEVVFFDEPTTGLDPILVNTIHHLIQELHAKFRFTAVVVSHEIPEIFGIADRVAMLHEGLIVETGPPDAIQASANPVVRQFIQGDVEAVGRPASAYAGAARREAVGPRPVRGHVPDHRPPRGGLAVRQARPGRSAGRPRLCGHRGLPDGGRAQGRLARRDRGRSDRQRGRHQPRRRSGARGHVDPLRHQAAGRLDRVDQDQGADRGEVHPHQPRRLRPLHPAQRAIREVEPPVDLEELLSKYVFGKV